MVSITKMATCLLRVIPAKGEEDQKKHCFFPMNGVGTEPQPGFQAEQDSEAMKGIQVRSRIKSGMTQHKNIFMGIALSLISASAFAWQPPRLFTKILSNGMRVIVQRNTVSKAAIVEVWYQVGSVDEPISENGVSHLLEHLMFRGTSDHPDGTFSRQISATGGWDNAFTSHDYTAYVDALPSSKIGLAFRLEADRMKHLQFSPQTFKQEKAVVKEERLTRIGDNPAAQLYERFNAVANMGSPLANPIIGWPDVFQQISYMQTYDWYAKWYQPQNATLVVVGDVNPKNVFNLAAQDFGKIAGLMLPQRHAFKGLKNPGFRELNVKLQSSVPILVMGYGVPAQSFPVMVAKSILGGGRSARLQKILVRQEHIASNISVSYHLLSRLKTQFVITAVPAPGVSVKTLEAAILSQIQTLKTTPVSMGELSRVKTQSQAAQIYAMDSLMGTAGLIGRIAVSHIPLSIYQNYVADIDGVTPKQIQKVAKHYFNHNNLTVAVLTPVQSRHTKLLTTSQLQVKGVLV